jgi:hypothetical protein
VVLLAEIGYLSRFSTASELMAWLGLVPSEDSIGEGVRRGPITKAGNKRARRALIEAVWSYRHPPRVGPAMAARVAAAPRAAREIAWKAQLRLSARYRRLTARGKRPTVAVTAIARQLAGFVWDTGRQVMPGGAGPWAVPPGPVEQDEGSTGPQALRRRMSRPQTNGRQRSLQSHNGRTVSAFKPAGNGGDGQSRIARTMPAPKHKAAPDEKADVRYPIRASEAVDRRQQAASPPLPAPPNERRCLSAGRQRQRTRIVLDWGLQNLQRAFYLRGFYLVVCSRR